MSVWLKEKKNVLTMKMVPEHYSQLECIILLFFLISGANDINLFCTTVPAYGLLSFPGVQ